MNNKYLPLSDVQRSYFYGRSKGTFLGGISTHFYIECMTSLDKDKLEKALNSVIKEQPSLRSYITSDGMQCCMDEAPEYYRIKETDISRLSYEEQEKKLLEIRKRCSNRIFDLDSWPMFEFNICITGRDKNVMIIDSDMMIMDGLSTEILIESLYKYYEKDEPVREISIEAFEDHIALKEQKKAKNYDNDKAFWKEIIEELPSGPHFERTGGNEERTFDTREISVPADKWGAKSRELKSERILPSVYLTAAYAKLLSRWCGQSRITLNMTMSNRKGNAKALLNAIGDFTEVMLVDFDFSMKKSLKEAAKETQKKISLRKKHGSVASSELIKDYMSLNGGGNGFPFPAVCTCMLFDLAGSKWDWLGERRYQISQTPQVILDNQISLKEGRLCIHWDFLGEYFPEGRIESMQEEYCSIITDNTEKLQQQYDSFAFKYNDTFKEKEKNTLVRLFADQVKKFPNKTAVADMKQSYTYSEIDRFSDIVADHIIKNHKARSAIIMRMTRSRNAVVAALGVIKAGGYYIPVAHNCPQKRLEFIKEQSESELILTDENVKEILADGEWGQRYDLSEPESIAYVIYTSGSTGTPKGVVITHDAVCNTITDINVRFSINSDDKIIGISSFSFDLSVFDIFGALSSGAQLKLAPSAYDMHLIKDIMTKEGVTIWNTVPSIMELLINNLDEGQKYNSLRTVLLSGDWIPLNLLQKIKNTFPNAQVISLGGATEGAIWSIYYPVKEVEKDWNSVPYGYPLDNQTIWIMDDDDNICPPGVRGEICIGGRGVAHGYLNDEERTKKQFFNHEKLGRIYRTGDLGLLSPKGYVIFLGRKDFQVKLYGYRIELGEIESCLCRCENVSEAVATVKEVNGVQKLFAYVTPMSVPGTGAVSDVQSTGGTDTTIRVFTAEGNEKFILPREDTNHAYPNMTEMYTALNSRVMDYMIPDDIIIMESLPYTANKKVNRKNLPVVNMVQAEDEVYEAPETETETMLAALIGEMIGNENVSVGANLINSGIDSLKGITLNTKLHDRGINIGLSEIYANPTIRQLGKLIDESGNGNEDMEFGEI